MDQANVVRFDKRQSKASATRKVTRQLVVAEAQLDRAGIELMKVGISLLEARAETGLSATFGAKSVTTTIDAIAGWNATRERIVAAHGTLLAMARMIGTEAVAVGDGGERPSISAEPGTMRADPRAA